VRAGSAAVRAIHDNGVTLRHERSHREPPDPGWGLQDGAVARGRGRREPLRLGPQGGRRGAHPGGDDQFPETGRTRAEPFPEGHDLRRGRLRPKRHEQRPSGTRRPGGPGRHRRRGGGQGGGGGGAPRASSRAGPGSISSGSRPAAT
jgi:hypothetical protein